MLIHADYFNYFFGLYETMVKKIFWVGGWCLWVTICYLASQFAVANLSSLFSINSSNSVLISTLLTIFIYTVLMVLVFGGIFLVYKNLKPNLENFKKLTGLTRKINWKDFWQAIITIILYFCILISVMLIFQMLFPEFANENQDVGFVKSGNNLWQLALIFISLTIVAPIAEELVMRGLLFGKLREKISFWPSAIIISLLFALAHGQVNVGIDTFILSMFLCYEREESGATWTSILMHSIKNLVGFLVSFVFVL